MIRAALLWLLCAGQAAALSCLPPDVVRTYREVDADSARWGAVVGRLDFDESRLPQPDRREVSPPQTEIRAQLIGHSLTPEGWTRPFQQNVTLRVQCIAAWCATPVSGRTYLAFVKREGARRVVIADPCGTTLFPRPARRDLDRLQSCFAGGRCEPDAP